MKRGEITYDERYGHVCTCARRVVGKTTLFYDYARTVEVDRSVEPTESGSWFYDCSRCGVGAWSGL